MLKIGIIGLGLIGGSLAKAFKFKLNAEIRAFNRSEPSLISAFNDNVINKYSITDLKIFSECDYIFICTPVDKITEYIERLLPYIKKGCVVTDCGSTKGDICSKMEKYKNSDIYFIGGHPMAGSEKESYKAADENLFENALYVLSPLDNVPVSVVNEFSDIIKKIGADPIVIDSKSHDYAAAAISHMPHIIAASIVNTVKNIDGKEKYMYRLAAGGFKDTTRIASGSPEVWSGICGENKREILNVIGEFKKTLNEFEDYLVNDDENAVYSFFEKARNYRNSLIENKLYTEREKTMQKVVYPKKSLNGTITVPGDKSISHRAVMFGSIAEGITEITGFLNGEDCMSTIKCFRKLGINIEIDKDKVTVYGKGLNGLKKPSETLDVGNSGTTIRLISGILAAQPFSCEITGDESIRKRPMKRVIDPLSLMGAKIKSFDNAGFAPLHIDGTHLKAIEYKLPVASAQVKSSILLASLFADKPTTIIEPMPSRNHTEIMLNYFGANIKNENGRIISEPVKQLYGKAVSVPSDISSAAFFIAAGLIVPNSHIIIKNVGINKTRTGIIDAFKAMGGDIKIINEKNNSGGESAADIEVKTSKLKAITLEGEIIPRMIDEIPVFAVASLFADGTTIIKDAEELKVKESNRIATMSEELGKMGAKIKETDDGMIIEGNAVLHGGEVFSHNDHRVAMSLTVAALMAQGETIINGADCVNISFPSFYDYIENL